MKEMEAKTENRYEYRKPQEKRKQMIAPDLFEFAYVPDWYGHLAELERLALPESWKFRKPSRETKNTDTPILERYIHTIFRKQVIDFNSESDPRKADSIFHLENECVCFHTGLYTPQYKGIYGYFERNNFSDSLITTSRFLGYDKNEYGDLIVNRKEAEIVSLTFDLYLLNVGSSRIGELLDYLGVKTVTGTTWESGTINGMLCNEKYKGDFHLQKYYTPENKRNHTRKNNGEVQSYYISENHEPIVSPEVWEKVQEVREQRKRDRNIGQDSTMKFQNRYPLSGMLICPYCGKTLRRRQVYKKKIQWLCSTYIEKGVKACKGIRIDDAELQGLNITEQTVIEEVVKNGKKHYCYTSKADFDCGIRNSTVSAEMCLSYSPGKTGFTYWELGSHH